MWRKNANSLRRAAALLILVIIGTTGINGAMAQTEPTASDELSIIPYRQGSKWGYCDEERNIVIPCIYDSCNPFFDELAAVSMDGKMGFINRKGDIVVPFKYISGFVAFPDGMAAVGIRENGEMKWGYIDTTGKEVIPCIYEYLPGEKTVGKFSDGMAVVCKNGKVGWVDKSGKEVIPCIYEKFNDWGRQSYGENGFSEGLVCVKLNGKWGYIDKTGRNIIPHRYDYAESFDSHGLAKVGITHDGWSNGASGYIDKTGKEIVPCLYFGVRHFPELGVIRAEMKYGSNYYY